MNTSTIYFATAVTGISLLLSFQKNENISKELTFLDAVNQGYVSCRSSGAGGFSGKSVIVNLTNKTSFPLNLKIKPGTLFYPSDEGQQTLITIEEQLIELAPKEKKKEYVYAYCSEHHERSPNTASVFKLGKNTNPKFDSLFTFMSTLNIPASSHQAIAWSISDNSPVSAVSSESLDLKKLRKYLFTVTKQEEEDLTRGYVISVDERGYIVKTLHHINGFIEFNSDKTKWLHQEVYDENGKMKFKSMQAFEIPKGKSDYTFYLTVKDWEKGSYTLKLKNGSEEVEKYAFKV